MRINILVMTINPNKVALKQRRRMAPPVQTHQKKKGNGSYNRNHFKRNYD